MDDNYYGGVVLVNIKRIFTDFDIDCEYAIVLSYRMARGDSMISQMWEPHQTSAFMNAALIKLYLFLTGTNTGVALYLNAVGILARLGVAYVFHRSLEKYCDRTVLFFMCAFFLTVNAKNSAILEFSNMMIYFSVLLYCALFTYLQRQNQQSSCMIFLILAAVSLCFEVLSYPSAIILFPMILVILSRYSKAKRRDIICFSGVCGMFGGSWLAALVFRTGWERFWLCVREIVTGDDSHQMDLLDRLNVYGTDVKNAVILLLFCILISMVITGGLLRAGVVIGKSLYVKIIFLILFLGDFVHLFLDFNNNEKLAMYGWIHLTVYFPILFLAYHLRGFCSGEERMGFCIGVSISIMSAVAVLLLTNLTLLTTAAYLILGIMVAMMPIGAYLRQTSPGKGKEKAYGMLWLFLLVVLFRNMYLIRPMVRFRATIFEIKNVVREGPLLGIFSEYMGPYIVNSNMADWHKYIQKGDRILLVCHGSTIGYLYEDTEISIDSTICTPTYNEKLLRYWEMNPWKEPNVVVVDCWFGELKFSEDEWIMKWIDENFDSYVDGTYVRFYRRGME